MKITGDAVKALRKRMGWSTYDLAEEIGCNQSTIWRIEDGANFGGVIEKSLTRLIAEHPAAHPHQQGQQDATAAA